LAAARAARRACVLLAQRAIVEQGAGGVEVTADVVGQAAEGAVEDRGGKRGRAVGADAVELGGE
jgi:hypothetical protein